MQLRNRKIDGGGNGAEAAAGAAIEGRPEKLGIAFGYLGMVLEAQGRKTEAHAAYTRALDAEPLHAEWWIRRGMLVAVEDPRRALCDLEAREKDQPLTLAADLEIARAAGLIRAEVLWREYREVVIGGPR